MIPRLNISFPLRRQCQYWCGEQYTPREGEYLLNHARSGIMMALKASVEKGGRVGVVAYNCYTVANAVVHAGYVPVFLDVTDDLTINADTIPANLDAIVVTNLFGILNDIETIRRHCPNAVIIVDNAHGYGLPAEGDFTVLSINQGKFPALGEGGVLQVNPTGRHYVDWCSRLSEQYEHLRGYGLLAQMRLFVTMQTKALLYSPLCFWLTRRLKRRHLAKADHQCPTIRRMAPGVSRIYRAAFPTIEKDMARQLATAERMKSLLEQHSAVQRAWYGDNAFMLLLSCTRIEHEQQWLAEHGIEAETHFRHAIDWAQEYGYQKGSCPNAERLVHGLLMVPTYEAPNITRRCL